MQRRNTIASWVECEKSRCAQDVMLRWHHALVLEIRFIGELAVSVLSYPSSPGEMAAMHTIGAFRFLTGIDPEQDRDGLAPIRPIDLGVEQTEI